VSDLNTAYIEFDRTFAANSSAETNQMNATIPGDVAAGDYFVVLDVDGYQYLANTHLDALSRRATAVTVHQFGQDIKASLHLHGPPPDFISAPLPFVSPWAAYLRLRLRQQQHRGSKWMWSFQHLTPWLPRVHGRTLCSFPPMASSTPTVRPWTSPQETPGTASHRQRTLSILGRSCHLTFLMGTAGGG
jgi:hypothetical protein